MRKFTFLARKAIGCDEPANHLLMDGISIAEFGDEVEGQTVCDILVASETEIESLNNRVWQAEHDLERCRVELELRRQRSTAQLEITRAAMEIVNAPFQIFDGRTGQRGYRISTKEFEDLEKAVKRYRDAAKLEQEEQNNGTNANEK